MSQLFNNFTSIGWWIGVVIVGLIINIVSTYLKPKIDVFLSSVSSKWATRNEKLRSARNIKVQLLRDNDHEQVMCYLQYLNQKLWVVIYMVFSVLTAVFAMYLKDRSPLLLGACFVFITLFLFFVLQSLFQGQSLLRLLIESRNNDDLN